MKTLVFFLALTLSGVASAQGKRHEGKQQMRQEDDALYRSMRGICRGC